jgi:signal transduction histidine kinase
VEQASWGYLVTRITDTGHGIKQEKMKDLFKTFKNVGKGGILTTAGIGIGLSTARTLTNAMGGFITVKSVEEIGTSITFAL